MSKSGSSTTSCGTRCRPSSRTIGGRRRSRIETGALLGGLFFDDRGNLMSPTYSIRRGNRYRYYISQARLRGGEAGSRPRIGADDVERLVVEELCRRQSRDGQVTDVATGVWSAEIRELVQTMVDRIVIHHDGIEITLKVKEMDRAIDGDNQSKSLKHPQASSPSCPSPRTQGDTRFGHFWNAAPPDRSGTHPGARARQVLDARVAAG